MVEWKTAKYFDEPFVSIGWDLEHLTTFPKVDYLGADTETKLYLNNKLLTEEEIYELNKKNGEKWSRTNVEVKAYAFMLSDGSNFALFQNPQDFLTCCAMMQVKNVYWYNARFDFAIFDYYFLTNNWKRSDDEVNEKTSYGKLGDKTYQSTDGDYGQRYSMRIWKEYKNRNGNYKVHKFSMFDICNIFGGGLERNLIDWGISDADGEEVRKLKMDYVNASVERDIQYMINDTKGLMLLAYKIEETLREITGYSLFKNEFMTAGGLAKKSMLKFMFKNDDKTNIELFHHFFPITLEEDKFFRDNHLYQGGKCLVNPYKEGKVQHNIYKYDVNSMYPNQMKNMLYPIGQGRKLEKIPVDREGKVYILCINNILGYLKKNMIGVWYDTLTACYVDKIIQGEDLLIWEEELKELENWYNICYNIKYVIEYDAKKFTGAMEYVDTFYNIKKNKKGTIRNGAKLLLNSAYGKLAQRIERQNVHYELAEEGYVHMVQDDIEIDEKSMMSVVCGSRVTALARVDLMQYIRFICKGNPKKYFIYCDTDSVHALLPYEDTDAKELGKMKNEGTYSWGKYLAPKTYILYDNIDEERYKFEVHTKGVNTNVVLNEVLKCKSLEEVDEIFSAGVKYKCLTSLNCKGGKALIYIDKYLMQLKKEKNIENDELYEGEE